MTRIKTKKYLLAERLNLKYQLTKRLYEKGYDKTQIKQLYLFLDWLIHLPPEDELKYEESIYTLERSKKMAYISTIERMGMERGIQQGITLGIAQGISQGISEGMSQGLKKGRQEGEATLLICVLESKFGPLPKKHVKEIMEADTDNLLHWSKQVLKAKTLMEVFVPVVS